MRHYEGLFILDLVMSEEKLKESLRSIEGLIKQSKGNVEKIEDLGNRKLQYSVKSKKEGYYYLIHFSIPPNALSELRKNYQLNEGILHFSIFRKEGEKSG